MDSSRMNNHRKSNEAIFLSGCSGNDNHHGFFGISGNDSPGHPVPCDVHKREE
jgi:hypothetical protein